MKLQAMALGAVILLSSTVSFADYGRRNGRRNDRAQIEKQIIDDAYAAVQLLENNIQAKSNTELAQVQQAIIQLKEVSKTSYSHGSGDSDYVTIDPNPRPTPRPMPIPTPRPAPTPRPRYGRDSGGYIGGYNGGAPTHNRYGRRSTRGRVGHIPYALPTFQAILEGERLTLEGIQPQAIYSQCMQSISNDWAREIVVVEMETQQRFSVDNFDISIRTKESKCRAITGLAMGLSLKTAQPISLSRYVAYGVIGNEGFYAEGNSAADLIRSCKTNLTGVTIYMEDKTWVGANGSAPVKRAELENFNSVDSGCSIAIGNIY